MSQDFTKSNPALERAIRAATNFEQIRELCVASSEQSHVLTRNRAGEVTVKDSFAGPAPQAPLPTSQTGRYFEVIYPSGNNRFELYADSPAELAELKQRILALFGKTI